MGCASLRPSIRVHGQFVDIHMHILPGVDDGARTLDDALDMARMAYESGTKIVVATPHLRSDFPEVHADEIASRCRDLRAALTAADVRVEVVEGGEVSLPWALGADLEELGLVTIGQRGTDLLIETPQDVTALEQLIAELRRRRGHRIVLAHPERSEGFQEEPQRLESLASHGVIPGLNASSFLAPKTSERRRVVERIARSSSACLIASDGHTAGEPRSVGALSAAAAAVSHSLGSDRALWLCSTVPQAVVRGLAIPPAPKRQRAWRRRWS